MTTANKIKRRKIIHDNSFHYFDEKEMHFLVQGQGKQSRGNTIHIFIINKI